MAPSVPTPEPRTWEECATSREFTSTSCLLRGIFAAVALTITIRPGAFIDTPACRYSLDGAQATLPRATVVARRG